MNDSTESPDMLDQLTPKATQRDLAIHGEPPRLLESNVMQKDQQKNASRAPRKADPPTSAL